MNFSELVAAVSVAIAAVSVLSRWWQSARQERLTYLGWQRDFLLQAHSWSDRSVELSTDVVRLLRASSPEEDFRRDRDQLRSSISAQIEKGRFLFPNGLEEEIGTWKEAAYRGLRQPMLDALVDLYDLLDDLDWSERKSIRSMAIDSHREFVSEMQRRLAPNRRDSTYKEFLNRYDINARLVGDWKDDET